MTTHSDAATAYVYSATLTRATYSTEQVERIVAAAFDAGVDHQESECTTRGHFGAVTVPAEPITTATELAEYEGTAEAFRDATGQVWRWHDGWWRMTGDDGSFSAVYVTQKRRLPLTLLAPASPPVPAPVLLTADDPRYRDGAKVRGEFTDGTAAECIIRNGVAWMDRGLYGFGFDDFAAVYLLAEAPDPDAVTLEALGWGPAVLQAIRAAGYDVVKRADA